MERKVKVFFTNIPLSDGFNYSAGYEEATNYFDETKKDISKKGNYRTIASCDDFDLDDQQKKYLNSSIFHL